MLAPIMTKDMRLFPSRPLPAGIKNVRSRAQSLDQFTNVQNSGTARGRIVPVKPRNSVSTGNLPTISRSPPSSSSSRKSTLSAIQEGIELKGEAPTTSAASSEPSLRTGTTPGKKMTAEQAAKISAAKQRSATAGNSSDSASDDGEKDKKPTRRRNVVKWLTSAFRTSSKENRSPETSPERHSTISS